MYIHVYMSTYICAFGKSVCGWNEMAVVTSNPNPKNIYLHTKQDSHTPTPTVIHCNAADRLPTKKIADVKDDMDGDFLLLPSIHSI